MFRQVLMSEIIIRVLCCITKGATMKLHKIPHGDTWVIWNPKWQRFVAGFFINTKIILLGFEQTFGLNYFFHQFHGNLIQQWRLPLRLVQPVFDLPVCTDFSIMCSFCPIWLLTEIVISTNELRTTFGLYNGLQPFKI